MLADRTQQNLILTLRLLDDDSVPIPSVPFNDVALTILYKKYGNPWVDITSGLSAGTIDTWADKTWVEDIADSLPGDPLTGQGLYQLGAPNESRIAGKRTLWAFKYGSNRFRFDSIDYFGIPTAGSDVPKFSFAIPGSDTLFTNNPQVYVLETGISVEFTANQDITGLSMHVIFESDDKVDKYDVLDGSLTKVGDKVTLALPSGFTDVEKSLNWAIRDTTTERVYGQGSISVAYAPHTDA